MSDLINFTAGHRPARVDPFLETSRKKCVGGMQERSDINKKAATNDFVNDNGIALGHRKNLASQFEKDHKDKTVSQNGRKPDPSILKQSDQESRVIGKKQTAVGAANRTANAPFAHGNDAEVAAAKQKPVAAAAGPQWMRDNFQSTSAIPAKGASSPKRKSGPRHLDGAPILDAAAHKAEADAVLSKLPRHIHVVADAPAGKCSMAKVLSGNAADHKFSHRGAGACAAGRRSSIGEIFSQQ